MRFLTLAGAIIFLSASFTQAWAAPAKFHKWIVTCSTDKVSDNKNCSMDQDVDVAAAVKEARVNFSIYRSVKSDKPQLMVFSSALQSGEPVYIRVDKNPATASQNYIKSRDAVIFPNSDSIISELKKGKAMFVRFTDRYTHIPYDADFDLQGFNEALDYLSSIKE